MVDDVKGGLLPRAKRRVEEAAKMVIGPVPSKSTPLMARAVWSLVAEPAFPEIEPVMVVRKVFAPVKVLSV